MATPIKLKELRNMINQVFKENMNISEELSIPQKHQKSIALKTLKMSDVGADLMGGMSKAEARSFLKSIGYTAEKIAQLEK